MYSSHMYKKIIEYWEIYKAVNGTCEITHDLCMYFVYIHVLGVLARPLYWMAFIQTKGILTYCTKCL